MAFTNVTQLVAPGIRSRCRLVCGVLIIQVMMAAYQHVPMYIVHRTGNVANWDCREISGVMPN